MQKLIGLMVLFVVAGLVAESPPLTGYYSSSLHCKDGKPFISINDWSPGELVKVIANGEVAGELTTSAEGSGETSFGEPGVRYYVALEKPNGERRLVGEVSCRTDIQPDTHMCSPADSDTIFIPEKCGSGDAGTYGGWVSVCKFNEKDPDAECSSGTTRCMSLPEKDECCIQITCPAPKPASIMVSPTKVALQPGQKQQFTAKGYDKEGIEVPLQPEWSASGGGSIDPGGLFSAGEAGEFTVTAAALVRM